MSIRVILASSSPRRRELLEMIGVAHEVIPAHIDETYRPGEPPAAHAERLARQKGERIAAGALEAVVISADTVVVIDGEVLGKPSDAEDAVRMLQRLSGRTHTVHTGVAVARRGCMESAVETVAVTFRTLSAEEIAAYVATGEPMDKAGAYGIQGYGALLVERIEGDFFAVMGLSLVRLFALLRRLGVRYDFRSLELEGEA
jgi:septum formation protein